MELENYRDGGQQLGQFPLHSMEFIYSAFDLVAEGILIVEEGKGVVYSNQQAREILGTDSVTFLTDTLMSHFPLTRTLKGEKVEDQRNKVELPNGKKIIISYSSVPIMDGAKIKGAIITFRDIGRLLEDERKTNEERIRCIHTDKMAALGSLSVEIAHQIQNPVTIVQGALAVIKKMIDEKESSENLIDRIDVIDGAMNRISTIVQSLKNLSRDSSNEEAYNHPLIDVLKDAYELTNTRIKMRGIALDIDLEDPVLEKIVFCPRIQVAEVLMNLLINAMDSVEDAEGPWIKIDVNETDEAFVFRIKDSGTGVPEDLRDKVFEPFFTTKEVGKGTGLGLPIARTIMRSIGGDVVYDPGCGVSCFEVYLPKQKN